MKHSIFLAGVVAATVAATPAMAAPVTLTSADLNQSFTIVYNGTDQNVNDPGSFTDGLSAEAVFTLMAFDTTNNFVKLSVDLTNTTEAPLASRISAFAFDVDPDVDSAAVEGDFYDEALLNKDMNAHGVGTVDLCFRSGGGNGNNGNNGGNCNQGAGGPEAGEAGTFEITLDFASLLADSEITFSNFVVRYQSLNFGTAGSGAGIGTCVDCQDEPPCTNGDCDPTPVTEPASLALLGLGLLGAGAARRRPRQ